MKLSDLQVMVQIIDLASEKGVFKGPDLKAVGETRERIIEFIKANAPQQPAEGEAITEEVKNESTESAK